MPELPEVETIARGLAHKIVGETIARVSVTMKKIAVAPKGVSFEKALTGEKIVAVDRRGKYAVIGLSSGRKLVTSLRMTGRLIVLEPGEPPYPYTHITLFFASSGKAHRAQPAKAVSDGLEIPEAKRLAFSEVRQFGRMRLVEQNEAWDGELGVEPLTKAFTPERFLSMLSGRTTPIKVLLLDQRRIAGIGNIYACEALWEARIRPDRPARTLTAPATRRLHEAIVDVLHRAIQMRGTSVDDYVDAEGLKGGFQNSLAVYGRSSKPCLRCGRTIVRTVLGQRGTWWCRGCQR